MKKVTLLSILAILLLSGCNTTELKSPSGKIRAEISTTHEGLFYKVLSDDRTICDVSSMGITVDGVEYFRNATLKLLGSIRIQEQYSVMGRKAICEDRCNQYKYEIIHTPTGYTYYLYARLYDDGFAYRFVLPGEGSRIVNNEVAQWRAPLDSKVWYAERNSGWKLLTYAGEWLSAPARSLYSISEQGPIQTMPLLYQTPNEYVMITEAALYNYSGMRLIAEEDGSLRANFTEHDGFEVKGDITTPWRVTIVASDLNTLVNTDIITNLNPAPDPLLFGDRSWIIPGKSLWSWWSNIDGKFMTPEGEREVIDIASRMNIEYSTIDEGWEDVADKWGFIAELVDYASDRGVGIFVWRHWEKLNNPEDDYLQMREFMDSLSSVGVKGIKVDFMNGEGKRQVDFNTSILENAAMRKMLINFHGCHKSTGEIRTYPNEMTREGVRGIELNRITAYYEEKMLSEGKVVDRDRYVPGAENQNIPARHNTILPFTRGVLGAADYTPIAFSMPGNTTAVHQLAFAFILDSPLLTIAENPFLLDKDPSYVSAAEIIGRMPTVWDETRVLPQSKLGEMAAFARKKDGVWYVAIVNTAATEFSFPINLPGKQLWAVTIVKDGEDEPLIKTTEKLSQGENIDISLPQNGGALIVLE